MLRYQDVTRTVVVETVRQAPALPLPEVLHLGRIVSALALFVLLNFYYIMELS